MSVKEYTRRNFMKYAGASFLAALAAPVAAFFFPKNLVEVPSEPVPVCSPDELPVGESKTIPFGRYPALVIHTPAGLRAYSAVCTHFACLVKYKGDTNQIACPCHEGFFDPEDGSVVDGPPPRPLDRFSVYVADDGQIYVAAESEEEA